MNFVTKLAFVIVAIGFIACNNDSIEPTEYKSVPLSETQKQLVIANNDFTFKIFSELEHEYANHNIFFSSLSMSTALAMALNGANGETKQQIKEVIDFGNYSDNEINEGFKNLQYVFSTLDKNVELSMANSAWYKQDYSLIEAYRNILSDYYYAQIEGVDFSDAATVKTINDWIANKTKDKITNMINELDPATVLVLVNAIYFNGTWKYEFDKEKTYDYTFMGLKNKAINCKMMSLGKIKTKFSVDTEKGMAILPYGEGNFEMVLYMPSYNSDFKAVIASLNANKLTNLINNATVDSVAIHLPKFKIETETFTIKDMLNNLGMTIPFTEQADFTNIFGSEHSIFIDDILHKAFIDVNEEGTEAAAATVITFFETSAGGGSNDKVIVFDHPFIFFIREASTGEILFAGKLIEPSV